MSASINTIPINALVEQSNLYGMQNTQQQRVNKILQLFDYSHRFKQIFIPRWTRNYEFYHNIDKTLMSRPEHMSRIFVPRPYLVVETKLPKLVQGILGKDPMFTALPVSSDDIVKARVAQEMLTRQWHQQDNGTLEMTCWMKDSFIYGLGIGKTGWEFQQEYCTRRTMGQPFLDPISMRMIPQEEVRTYLETTVDRPFFKNIDLSEIYWDPQATIIEDCKFIINKYKIARHYLEQMERLQVYSNVSSIPRFSETPVDDAFGNRQWSTKNFTSVDSQTVTNDPIYETVEIMECWWIDGDRKMKTVVANRTTIIQDIPMPYWHQRWPFYQLKDTPLTGEFVGLGEIDPIEHLVSELNDIRNQQNDNRWQFLKAFWVVNRTANVDLEALENMPPGGILEVTGQADAALTVLRPPSLDGMTMQAQAQIDSDIQMTSGANDIAIGTPTRSQVRTATTGSLLAESANTRFALTALLYLEQMRKVGRDWLALNQQYMSQPLAVRVLGADGLQMQNVNATPYDIPHQFDLYVTMGADLQGDVDIIRQQSLQLFQLMAAVPGFQITEYAKEVLSKFNEKNPERFFEGSHVVPTEQILQQMGVDDKSVMSGYVEQMAGMKGGGTQQVRSRADVLQYAKNNNQLQGVQNAA